MFRKLGSLGFKSVAPGVAADKMIKMARATRAAQGVGMQASTALVETASSILKPAGRLIGTQLANNPLIRTVTQSEAISLTNRLIASGAKISPKASYKGVWYELPGGGGFGVRNVVSGKSLKLGSTGAIDINIPGIAIKNIKF